MSRSKDLAKNTLILSVGNFLPKLTLLVTLPIITGHLTKEEYGTYDLITTLASLYLPAITLQIQSAAFRFLIDSRNLETEKKTIISNVYCFVIPVSAFAVIVLFIFLNWINTSIRILIALYFFFNSILVITQQITRGLSKNGLYSLSSIIQSVLSMFLILFLSDIGLIGVLLSLLISSIFSCLLLQIGASLYRYFEPSLFSYDLLIRMIKYSWPMIPTALSLWVLSLSDRVVISTFLGLEAAGIYAVANKIPQQLNTVQSTFAYAWQENASLAVDDLDAAEYYSIVFDSVFCIICGFLAVLISFYPFLFMLLIKGNYNAARAQIPILFGGFFFSAVSSLIGGIYIAHKRTKSLGISTIIAAVCNLVIDLGFVKCIGIYAASISTLCSYLFLAVYRMWDVNRFQTISYNLKKILLSIIILATMCCISWIDSIYSIAFNLFLGIFLALYLNWKIIRKLVSRRA